MKMKRNFGYLYLFFLVIFLSCEGTQGDGFATLEDNQAIESGEDSSTEKELSIESHSPISTDIILTSSENQTFAVQVSSGAGDVTYQFVLDGTTIQESSSPFYDLDASTMTTGAHFLKVNATNSINSDSVTFAVAKNTPPVVSLTSNTTQTISCSSGTFTMDISVVDADGDTISFTGFLNGSVNTSNLVMTNTTSTSSVMFTPNCAMTGNNTVKLRATDQNGEYDEYSLAVVVTNPNAASVDSYSPTNDPVVILSTGSQPFLISASGNAPMTYSWLITPGSTIASCNNLASCSIGGGDFSPGEYTLQATATDNLATSDSHSFNLVINQKPQITTQSPSNTSTVKMNCASNKNFQLTVSDANWSDGQSFTMDWYLDGSAHSSLTHTNNLAVHPMTTDSTFSPNCDETLIGDHTVKVVVSDGYESQEITWNVNVNYFSDTCNNLTSGQICTLAGYKGVGSGLTADHEDVRIYPSYIEKFPGGGYFISEHNRHMIWYYNNTGSSITVLGKTVAANTIKAMFGQPNHGAGTDGKTYQEFYLNQPRDMAYSTSEQALYVADYANNRVVRFDNTGAGTYWAGSYNNTGVKGDPRKDHRCRGPIGLEIDESKNTIYSTCYNNTSSGWAAIMAYKTDSDTGYPLIKYGGSYSMGAVGTASSNPAATTRRTYSVAKDPNSDILYIGDFNSCGIMAASTGSAINFHGGSAAASANNTVMVVTGKGCSDSFSDKTWNDSGHRIRPYDIEVYSDGGVTKGLLWSQQSRHTLVLQNLTSSDITLGGRTVSGGKMNNVYGYNNGYDYARGEPAYLSTHMKHPLGLLMDGATLYIADLNNAMIASFDTSTTSGASDDLIGNIKINDYDGEDAKQANKRSIYRPRALSYSASENALYFYEYGVQRMRKLDLDTGDVELAVGRGSSNNADTPSADPEDVYFRNIGDIYIQSDASYALYTDYQGSNGALRNCQARLFNMLTTTESLYGESIPGDKVNDVAGNFALGCQVWDGSYEGADATSSALRYPIGIVASSDDSNMLIADRYMDCILKVNSSGVLNAYIGQCESAGDVSGTFSSVKFNNPGDLEIDGDSTYAVSTNFFVVDRWLSNPSYIKYVNLSGSTINFFGAVDVASNTVEKLIQTDGYTSAVASFEDEQICYTQGANRNANGIGHNVICVYRSTGYPSLRIGNLSAASLTAESAEFDEDEGVSASSAGLSSPWGLAFDSEGNLYITEYSSHHIRMVKRWF